MPFKQMPQFKATPNSMFELPQPGIGGLNLTDLEYEQNVNQSPYMLNMMYRNGAFSKRYGQGIDREYENTIYAITYFNEKIIVHSGTGVYADGDLISGEYVLPEKKGLFTTFHQTLYYITTQTIYQYSYETENQLYVWKEIEPYIPDVLINCKPDGTYSDVVDDYNIIGVKYKMSYNGDGTSTDYHLYGNNIDAQITPTVEVDGEETSAFTFDAVNKIIRFTTAPSEGSLNVVITASLEQDALKEDRDRIYGAKYAIAFGGNNNSRLFLAGGGYSKYFYSNAYDATYFPENNFAILGNTEEDITGFGLQYNVLIVFKPREMYSLTHYIQTAQTTIVQEDIGLEAFRSQLVNPRIGCDAPYTIQLINNQLTWYNSTEGVCCLVSTSIIDERNVRPISRNINRTNNMGVKGILDYREDLDTIQSVDFDSKYFLVFPESGKAYVWDYGITPYAYYTRGDTDVKSLDWFIFDHFFVKQFCKAGRGLIYSSTYNGENDFTSSLVRLNESFNDLDFNGDGEDDAIEAYYMTPFLQFNAVEYLKNIKELYIQCRGDTASVIDVWYYTDASSQPEQDTESIRIGGRLWHKFEWNTFQWLVVAWANTFRRKCNLKKIQMASFYFYNNEVSRDMSITHIGLSYQVIKTVR